MVSHLAQPKTQSSVLDFKTLDNRVVDHLNLISYPSPVDGSLPGSSVLGILQARTLEWVAISFSNA